MKKIIKNPITAAYHEGLISIWWYTDEGEFWDFSVSFDNAVEDHGYLQYSTTKNHKNLWYSALEEFVNDVDEREKYKKLGYKAVERGRVIYDIRSQHYEILCSEALLKDINFRNRCVEYFELSGNRYDFVPMHHYGKLELTGNPAIDSMYYEW